MPSAKTRHIKAKARAFASRKRVCKTLSCHQHLNDRVYALPLSTYVDNPGTLVNDASLCSLHANGSK